MQYDPKRPSSSANQPRRREKRKRRWFTVAMPLLLGRRSPKVQPDERLGRQGSAAPDRVNNNMALRGSPHEITRRIRVTRESDSFFASSQRTSLRTAIKRPFFHAVHTVGVRGFASPPLVTSILFNLQVSIDVWSRGYGERYSLRNYTLHCESLSARSCPQFFPFSTSGEAQGEAV